MRFNTKNQIRPWTTQMEIKSWIKRPCECTIAHDISLENVSRMHELSEAFHAISLRHTCLLSILEQFSKLSSRAGYVMLSLSLSLSLSQSIYICHFY
ncbi:ARM repeat protein interacting with ABF2 [Vitis vinifera]|uniref:ARM repeat protein interacting with ABF2 n=1 Tax=Vitis vinifera TaxID=29760 RepID=A0A438C4X1_VITVI|nr:ARM repeat protein interacting with ABF2 [Vitis vinifera]RVW18294.1 ARM repeat protein interacting with ABF2 [Vitis vinifera]